MLGRQSRNDQNGCTAAALPPPAYGIGFVDSAHGFGPAAPVQRAGGPSAPASPSSGARMPGDVKAKMEGAFGFDFSAVRIHQGSEAASIGALAFARGTDIHFAAGQYRPHERRGQEILGHELAHVVQQSQGRVAVTTQAMGLAINDDPALEHEADEMGRRAAQAPQRAPGAGPSSALGSLRSIHVAQAVLQRCDGVAAEQAKVNAEKPGVDELAGLGWGVGASGRLITDVKLDSLIASVRRSIRARQCVALEHGGADAGHAARIVIEEGLLASAQAEKARRDADKAAKAKAALDAQNKDALKNFPPPKGPPGNAWGMAKK